MNINQVSANTLAQAAADPTCNATTGPTVTCSLTKTVANPFPNYSTNFTAGNQQYSTISSVELNKPFPQYGAISNTGNYVGVGNYNALQAKVEKRFSCGGMILGSYTFSKLLTNAESLTSWLETVGAPGYQNTNNLAGEYSFSGYDSRHRLVVSYVYNLPFGRGERYGAGVTGIADYLSPAGDSMVSAPSRTAIPWASRPRQDMSQPIRAPAPLVRTSFQVATR